MTFVSLLASLTRTEKSYTRKLHWVWQQGIEQSIAPLYWSLILCASAHFPETILRGLRCEKTEVYLQNLLVCVGINL